MDKDYSFVMRVIAIVKGLLVFILILTSWLSFLASFWAGVLLLDWRYGLVAFFWGFLTMMIWSMQLTPGKSK